ncbi:MAG: hypothetical protein ABIP57_01135 [Jatrophihabitantaceae bacterium]
MRIELVVVADCPHEEAAGDLMCEALDDIGLGSEAFDVIVVEGQSMADGLHFVGSPTFRVEGRDLFDEPHRPTAVACRIYPAGPLPSLRALRRALKEAAAAALERAVRAAARLAGHRGGARST